MTEGEVNAQHEIMFGGKYLKIFECAHLGKIFE